MSEEEKKAKEITIKIKIKTPTVESMKKALEKIFPFGYEVTVEEEEKPGEKTPSEE